MENIDKMLKKREENFSLLKNQKEKIYSSIRIIKTALTNRNKILFCGNGGSASDANHIASEFVTKFQKEKNMPAISLSSNTSIITALANDYSFEDIFQKQIECLGNKGDVLIAISTSGKSKNVLKAIKQANKQGLKTIFLTGINQSEENVDVEINAQSDHTCEIQEMHIAVGHIIYELID